MTKSQVGIGHRCNLCNFWFSLKDLFDHKDLGFICYRDKANYDRELWNEKRFEWEQGQAQREQVR